MRGSASIFFTHLPPKRLARVSIFNADLSDFCGPFVTNLPDGTSLRT